MHLYHQFMYKGTKYKYKGTMYNVQRCPSFSKLGYKNSPFF